MARKGGRDRGVYFRPRLRGEVLGPKGQRGEWWVCVFVDGIKHREKAGTKSAARVLAERRRTEVRQGRQFPENLRLSAPTTLREIADSYLLQVRANGRKTAGRIKTRLAEALDMLGPMPAGKVRLDDLERLKARLAEGPRCQARTPG